MKYTSKLTKRCYFPLVEGSRVGFIFTPLKTFSAFTTYIVNTFGGLTKTTNFRNDWHWFLGVPITFSFPIHRKLNEELERIIRRIHKANLYLNRQYNRLERSLEKGDIEKYYKLIEILEKRSKLFGLVILIKRTSNRWMEFPITKVMSILKIRNELLRKDKTQARYTRKFIPEFNPDGSIKKYRPLGVPTIEWRMVAATKEFSLVNLLHKDWFEHQYACIPGKGAGSAWIEILRRVEGIDRPKAVRIYGYDLAKFFDTVQINWIRDALEEAKVPDKYSEWFVRFNKSQARIDPRDQQRERERITKTHLESPRAWWKFKGLPQGMNTSPILACLGLQRTMLYKSTPKDSTIVQYVDDGLIIHGPNGAKETEQSLWSWTNKALYSGHSGLAFNEEKTEIIMNEGKFLKPLKFLGCSYDGFTFKAHTRSKGVYEVKNAKERIEEIIQWLGQEGNSQIAYVKLNQLIAEGWNFEKEHWTTVPVERDQPLSGLTGQSSKWFEETKTKVVKLKANSVEAMTYKYFESLSPYLMLSTNMASMCCSFYLLEMPLKRSKYKTTQSSSPNSEELETSGTRVHGMWIWIYWICASFLIPYILIWISLKF